MGVRRIALAALGCLALAGTARAQGDGPHNLPLIPVFERVATQLAGKVSIVTVEEVVDELPATPGAIVLPSWAVTAVCHVPNGAHPSFAMGYSDRDNAFYAAWDDISKDRDTFMTWIGHHILSTADHAEYRRSLGLDRDGVRV